MSNKTNEMLKKIKQTRNLKYHTIKGYKKSINYFEEQTHTSLPELIEIHEKERKKGVKWINCTLYESLIQYRDYLKDNYKQTTAREYFAKIIAFLNFFDVEFGKIEKPKEESHDFRRIDEVLKQEELEKAIHISTTPAFKPILITLSATGMSPIDLLEKTKEDYMNATSEYHNYAQHKDIHRAILEMEGQDVIPLYTGHRRKTKRQYFSYASPESAKSTNNYLLGLEGELLPDTPLFKISRRQLNSTFTTINKQLKLGDASKGGGRLTMENLRSFHANQLKKAGVSEFDIEVLEGRKPSSILYKHYYDVDLNELKETYIKALPYLAIEDINKVKTELEVVKEEKQILEVKYTEIEEENKKLGERMSNIEKIVHQINNKPRSKEDILRNL